MSARSMLLAVLALGLTSAACQPPVQEEASGALSDADIAAIRQVTEEWVQANRANDWAAVAAFRTEDAVFMPPNEPVVAGRAAIQEWLTPFTSTDFNVTPVQTEGRDGLAYTRGVYSLTVTIEGTPEPITDTGKYVQIWREQPDGSWLIVVDIWNSDLPLLAATEE